jgi:hypothetical protein
MLDPEEKVIRKLPINGNYLQVDKRKILLDFNIQGNKCSTI